MSPQTRRIALRFVQGSLEESMNKASTILAAKESLQQLKEAAQRAGGEALTNMAMLIDYRVGDMIEESLQELRSVDSFGLELRSTLDVVERALLSALGKTQAHARMLASGLVSSKRKLQSQQKQHNLTALLPYLNALDALRAKIEKLAAML